MAKTIKITPMNTTPADSSFIEAVKDTFSSIAETVGLGSTKKKTAKPKKSLTSTVKKAAKKAAKKLTTAAKSAKKSVAVKKSTKSPAAKKSR